MQVTVTAEYILGMNVYLRIRSERVKGRVTGMHLRGASLMRRSPVIYTVVWEDTAEETEHYEDELTETFVEDFSKEDRNDD